jgi:hypothetical protein
VNRTKFVPWATSEIGASPLPWMRHCVTRGDYPQKGYVFWRLSKWPDALLTLMSLVLHLGDDGRTQALWIWQCAFFCWCCGLIIIGAFTVFVECASRKLQLREGMFDRARKCLCVHCVHCVVCCLKIRNYAKARLVSIIFPANFCWAIAYEIVKSANASCLAS